MATVRAHKEIRAEFASAIGKRIFWARKAINITQSQVARELGLADSTAIGYWESGAHCPPSYLLAELADLLGVSLDYLVRGKD